MGFNPNRGQSGAGNRGSFATGVRGVARSASGGEFCLQGHPGSMGGQFSAAPDAAASEVAHVRAREIAEHTDELTRLVVDEHPNAVFWSAEAGQDGKYDGIISVTVATSKGVLVQGGLNTTMFGAGSHLEDLGRLHSVGGDGVTEDLDVTVGPEFELGPQWS